MPLDVDYHWQRMALLFCIGNIFALGFCFVTLYVIVTTLRVLREKISDALDETLPDHLERRMKAHVDHHRLTTEPRP